MLAVGMVRRERARRPARREHRQRRRIVALARAAVNHHLLLVELAVPREAPTCKSNLPLGETTLGAACTSPPALLLPSRHRIRRAAEGNLERLVVVVAEPPFLVAGHVAVPLPALHALGRERVGDAAAVHLRRRRRPGHDVRGMSRRPAALLVAPVRGNAKLRLAVHVLRSNLHLERASVAVAHDGVQAAVPVLLRATHVVLQLAGNGLEQLVHEVERGVAVVAAVHDDAHRHDVVHLAEFHLLLGKFLPQAVQVLRPSGYGCKLHLARVENLAHLVHVRSDVAELVPLLDTPAQIRVFFGVQKLEAHVLEFSLPSPHAESVRDGCKHSQGLEHVYAPNLRQGFSGGCLLRENSQRREPVGEEC
mmetsp:Transcript_3471/g.7824  ORF Transcript_3471/g.7824 Transcript_3471/m.7824 type:complete len:364 (+) Transcript_3471:410-1501(+)